MTIDENPSSKALFAAEAKAKKGYYAFDKKGNPHEALTFWNEAISILSKHQEHKKVQERISRFVERVNLLVKRAMADGAPEGFTIKVKSLMDQRGKDQFCESAAELVYIIGTQLQYVLAESRDGKKQPEIFEGKPEEFLDFDDPEKDED
ncbi:MAG: hypothetical protein WC806_05785 [Candidatus Gracilibacteria bacterium]|jgi:hypothetical protein